MKNSTISKPWSYLIDLVSTDAVKSRRRSTLWLMLFTLLLLPTSMVAQTDYDTSITFSALAGSPEGFDNEKYPNLFDGKKYHSNSTKWCGKFVSNGGTYVIFEASKAGIPVGYTITTGNDNRTYKGRNPRSWKLYGNNEGKNGAWTLIQEVSNDTKLQDVDCASYDFTCEGSTPYKYFKWEITGIRNKDYIQVGEFELKLNTGYQTYAEFDEGTGTLTFTSGPSKPEGAYDLNEGSYYPGWWPGQSRKIKTVVFDASFANARPTSCYCWFSGCNNLTEIKGIEYLNTENVTNMGFMFNSCKVLTSLNLSNFNTEKVMYMSNMFYNCNKLTSLDLTSFNTAEVTNMTQMFYNSYALTTIYASDNFVTGQVTTSINKSINMFSGCNELIGAIKYAGNNTNDKDYANYLTGYFTKLVGKNGNDKIGATGETLTAESLALDDNKDFVAYEPFAVKAASYIRPMKAGTTWGTLCLPFEVSLDGQSFRAFKLLSANDATNTIVLEEITTSIAAGTPVIIKMNEGATALKFSVANEKIAHQVVSAADGNYQLQGLYAKKVFVKGADDNCYIVKGNKLMNPSKLLENTKVNDVNCKAFRAYMVDNSSTPAGAKMFSIGFDETATAIDNLNTNADDKAEYYDLQGHRLNGPQKGINIVKRGNKTMKVIIK